MHAPNVSILPDLNVNLDGQYIQPKVSKKRLDMIYIMVVEKLKVKQAGTQPIRSIQ